MTSLAITGWSVLCPAGIGPRALMNALDPVRGSPGGIPPGNPGDRSVTSLYAERLPHPVGHALTDFSVRGQLGRKGTGFFDRVTGLGVVACGLALDDSGIRIRPPTAHGRIDSGDTGSLTVARDRIGIVLGTTVGSLKSTMDFSSETLLQDRPYLVNPGLFPNTVLNCVAGQAAIWYGVSGVNATVAGGQLALLNVLCYARRLIAQGHADVLLAGVAEEFTPHTAWAEHLTCQRGEVVQAGEGAVVLVLERTSAARAAGRRVDAELLAVATGFCPDAASADNLTPGTTVSAQEVALNAALKSCVRKVTAQARVDPSDILPLACLGPAAEHAGQPHPVSPGADTSADLLDAVIRATAARRERVRQALGECHAASSGLELAALLAAQRDTPPRDGAVFLITACTREGGVGAAVLRGCYGVSGHHR